MKRQVLPMMAALGCLAGLFTSSCFTQIPSGEQSSKLDASVSGDMAMRRNCAGFEAYPGTELACWNFQDEATRNDALRWAMVRYPPPEMGVNSDVCWYGEMGSIRGGSGSAKEPQPCELWLAEVTLSLIHISPDPKVLALARLFGVGEQYYDPRGMVWKSVAGRCKDPKLPVTLAITCLLYTSQRLPANQREPGCPLASFHR